VASRHGGGRRVLLLTNTEAGISVPRFLRKSDTVNTPVSADRRDLLAAICVPMPSRAKEAGEGRALVTTVTARYPASGRRDRPLQVAATYHRYQHGR